MVDIFSVNVLIHVIYILLLVYIYQDIQTRSDRLLFGICVVAYVAAVGVDYISVIPASLELIITVGAFVLGIVALLIMSGARIRSRYKQSQ